MDDMDRQLEKAAEYAGDIVRMNFRAIARGPNFGESPIEKILGWHIVAQMWIPEAMGYCAYMPSGSRYEDTDPKGKAEFTFTPQAKIGRYKADFLLAARGKDGSVYRFAIECDGHDFHEKTKVQAAHDKKRDRFFTAQDIRLFRFTGSEIWRDAPGCIDELMGAVLSITGMR